MSFFQGVEPVLWINRYSIWVKYIRQKNDKFSKRLARFLFCFLDNRTNRFFSFICVDSLWGWCQYYIAICSSTTTNDYTQMNRENYIDGLGQPQMLMMITIIIECVWCIEMVRCHTNLAVHNRQNIIRNTYRWNKVFICLRPWEKETRRFQFKTFIPLSTIILQAPFEGYDHLYEMYGSMDGLN